MAKTPLANGTATLINFAAAQLEKQVAASRAEAEKQDAAARGSKSTGTLSIEDGKASEGPPAPACPTLKTKGTSVDQLAEELLAGRASIQSKATPKAGSAKAERAKAKAKGKAKKAKGKAMKRPAAAADASAPAAKAAKMGFGGLAFPGKPTKARDTVCFKEFKVITDINKMSWRVMKSNCVLDRSCSWKTDPKAAWKKVNEFLAGRRPFP